MRHYEIVFLVHPDQSEQVPSMVGRYKSLVEKHGGQTHRIEDWGRRQLAYQIKSAHKAHYVLMNIEAGQDALQELEGSFRYNDAVLRHIVVRTTKAITDESVMMKRVAEEKQREEEREVREREMRRRYKERKAEDDDGDGDEAVGEDKDDIPGTEEAEAEVSSDALGDPDDDRQDGDVQKEADK